jgi:hypothetical protein
MLQAGGIEMATYGTFNTNGGMTPLRKYEGDLMEQDGEFVKIFETLETGGKELVVSIRLERNQSVEKILAKASAA